MKNYSFEEYFLLSLVIPLLEDPSKSSFIPETLIADNLPVDTWTLAPECSAALQRELSALYPSEP